MAKSSAALTARNSNEKPVNTKQSSQEDLELIRARVLQLIDLAQGALAGEGEMSMASMAFPMILMGIQAIEGQKLHLLLTSLQGIATAALDSGSSQLEFEDAVYPHLNALATSL